MEDRAPTALEDRNVKPLKARCLAKVRGRRDPNSFFLGRDGQRRLTLGRNCVSIASEMKGHSPSTRSMNTRAAQSQASGNINPLLVNESPGLSPPAPPVDRSRRYTRILWILFLCTLPLVNPIVHGDGVGYYAYVRAPLGALPGCGPRFCAYLGRSWRAHSCRRLLVSVPLFRYSAALATFLDSSPGERGTAHF